MAVARARTAHGSRLSIAAIKARMAIPTMSRRRDPMRAQTLEPIVGASPMCDLLGDIMMKQDDLHKKGDSFIIRPDGRCHDLKNIEL